MKTITVKELQQCDPTRFQKEYSKWAQEGPFYEWWDYMEEGFKEDMDAEGIHVHRIAFSLGYCQSDYAAFEGQIRVAEFMELKGYDVEYPALYLAVKEYGDRADVGDSYHRRNSGRVSWDANCIGNTNPEGVFSMLDEDAWNDLVDEQHGAAGLEGEMQSYVDEKCNKLHRDLQDAYEHLTSEESFIESCECNEITFEIEDDEHEIST